MNKERLEKAMLAFKIYTQAKKTNNYTGRNIKKMD